VRRNEEHEACREIDSYGTRICYKRREDRNQCAQLVRGGATHERRTERLSNRSTLSSAYHLFLGEHLGAAWALVRLLRELRITSTSLRKNQWQRLGQAKDSVEAYRAGRITPAGPQ
jgi:hypothetical protein